MSQPRYTWEQVIDEPDDDGRTVWILTRRATGARIYVVRDPDGLVLPGTVVIEKELTR